jgi:hypothetical protein
MADPLEREVVKKLQDVQHARAQVENLVAIAATSNVHEVRLLARLIDELTDDIFFALVDIDHIHQDGGAPSFMGLDRVTAANAIVQRGIKRGVRDHGTS